MDSFRLSNVSTARKKEWVAELNAGKKDFLIREIRKTDITFFSRKGFYARTEAETMFYGTIASQLSDGKTCCFMVESVRLLNEVVCAFCLKAHVVNGFKMIEISHLDREYSYDKLLSYLHYKHVGKTVCDEFAIPLAKYFCTELGAKSYFAVSPNIILAKHFASDLLVPMPKNKVIGLFDGFLQDESTIIMLGPE